MKTSTWKARAIPSVAITIIAFFLFTPSASADEEPLAGFKKGFFLKSADGNFKLKLGTRVQARYQFDGVDGFGDADDKGEGADDKSSFSIPRARLTLKGNAFNKDLTYKFQMDFSKGLVNLKDFFANYKLSDSVHIRAGQWKRPFSRQQINSSSRLAMVDRAITDKKFGSGRDVGVAIHNNYEKSPEIEWAVGVFNGTSVKPSISTSVTLDTTDPAAPTASASSKMSNAASRFQPAFIGRVGYNMGGIKGYTEGDHQGGDFRLAVGAGAMWFHSFDDEASAMRANVDFIMKVSGFALSGAFYAAMDESVDGQGNTSLGLSAMGLHAQANFLISNAYQPVVQFAWHMPETVAPGAEDEKVMTLGFNWFFYGHKVKWQTDVSAAMTSDGTDGGDATDLRLRTQMQFAF
jgi:hypothetical protein